MLAPSNNGRSIFLSKKTILHWVAKPQRGAPGYIHVRVLRNRTIFPRTVRGVAGSCRNAYMLQFAAKCFKLEESHGTSEINWSEKIFLVQKYLHYLINKNWLAYSSIFDRRLQVYFFAIYSWSKILNEMHLNADW